MNLDLTNNPRLIFLDCYSGSLTSLNISSNSALRYLNANGAGNALDQPSIDTIFGNLDFFGLTTNIGYLSVDVSGGTTNASPSTNASQSITNLTNKGWILNYNH